MTGTVTNTKGKALGGICVLIEGANGGSEAETNPDGSYSASGLFSGKYTVQFSAECENTGSYLEQYYNGKPNAVTADPVTLTAGHVTTGVDATMQPGGTVTGILIDSAGHRLSGVCVGIASPSDELFGDGTFTDIEFTSNGSFRAQNLSPGTYGVNFGCGIGPFATQWSGAGPPRRAPTWCRCPRARSPQVSAASSAPRGRSPAPSPTAPAVSCPASA